MGYMCDKEIGTVDWDALNFKKSGADYYKEKFPEFGLSVYQILRESTKDKKKWLILVRHIWKLLTKSRLQSSTSFLNVHFLV